MSSASPSHDARAAAAASSIQASAVDPGRDRVREQRRSSRSAAATRAAELAAEPSGAQLALARQPVARLALERRRAVPQHLAGERLAPGEHGVVGRLGERARRRRDAAAGARDLLVRHARHLPLVLLRAPAGERQVRVAVDEAGDDRAAGRVDLHAPRRRGVEARDQPPPSSTRRARASARPRGRGAGRAARRAAGAAPRRRRGSRPRHGRIGIRTPRRSAASIASS